MILNIEGMHCMGCVNRIKKVLLLDKNIKDVSINLETKVCEIEGNDLDIDNIIEKINNLGFKATRK